MSERVLPTEPGWWRNDWYADSEIEPLCVYVRDYGVGLGLCWDHVGAKHVVPVDDPQNRWLEPVAPLGTAARLASAEAELADLKRRIAAAPVAWAVMAGSSNRLLAVDLSRMTADEEAESWYDDNDPTSVMRVRLLEVRDGE